MLIDERVKVFNATTSKKKTYSVDEVVAMIGCTRQTVYKLINQGCFEAIKIERAYRIMKESFDRWLDNE